MNDSTGVIQHGARVLVKYYEDDYSDPFEATFEKISALGYRIVVNEDGTRLVLDPLDTMILA